MKHRLPSLNKKRFSRADAKRLGNELRVNWNKIPLKEFQKGINHELEHRNILDNIKELGLTALTHLKEDPEYYTKIERVFKKKASLSIRAVKYPEQWHRDLWLMKKTADPYNGPKVSKREAEYIPNSPDPLDRCENCEYFNKDSTCDRVFGKVSPNGLCRFFEVIPRNR